MVSGAAGRKPFGLGIADKSLRLFVSREFQDTFVVSRRSLPAGVLMLFEGLLILITRTHSYHLSGAFTKCFIHTYIGKKKKT